MNDLLGRPIKVGDTIITNRPKTASMGLITKVLRVNKSAIVHAVNRRKYNRVTKVYDDFEGTITKRSYQVLVIDEQIEANQTKFPEAY